MSIRCMVHFYTEDMLTMGKKAVPLKTIFGSGLNCEIAMEAVEYLESIYKEKDICDGKNYHYIVERFLELAEQAKSGIFRDSLGCPIPLSFIPSYEGLMCIKLKKYGWHLTSYQIKLDRDDNDERHSSVGVLIKGDGHPRPTSGELRCVKSGELLEEV